MNRSKSIVENKINHNFITFSEERKKDVSIGCEIELPIASYSYLNKKWNRDATDIFFNELLNQFSFAPYEFDNDDKLISVRSTDGFGDVISLEFSIWIIEISFGPSSQIINVEKRFLVFLKYIQSFLKRYDCYISDKAFSYDEQKFNNGFLNTPKHQILRHHLANYDPSMLGVQFGTFISSVQTHLQIDRDLLSESINIYSQIEWIKGILLSNSFKDDFCCVREEFWRKSFFGQFPESIGTFEKALETFQDIVDVTVEQAIFYVKRGDLWIAITPMKLKDYFVNLGKEIDGLAFSKDGTYPIKVVPAEGDINYFRSYSNNALTKFGTIEVRSDCSPPMGESFSPVAFNLGIHLGGSDLKDIIAPCSYDSCRQLRQLSILNSGQIIILQNKKLKKIIKDVVFLVKERLVERNKGEEKFIQPILNKVEKMK